MSEPGGPKLKEPRRTAAALAQDQRTNIPASAEYAEQRMQVYHDKAVEVLMTLPESEAREGLLLLADYIVERRK